MEVSNVFIWKTKDRKSLNISILTLFKPKKDIKKTLAG